MMLLLLSLITTLVVLVSSDTPANCSYEDIRGKWIFSETERTGDQSENCTTLGPVVQEVVLDLQYPNVVSDCQGNEGHWTLVYNQGFEVTINQRKYFAFSYYEQEEDNVTSYCDRTFNGWSHDILVRNWACYNAKKVDSVPPKSYFLPSPQLHSRRVFRNSKNFIKAINAAQDSWTARPYPQFDGMSHEDMLRMKGGRKSRILWRPSPAPVTPDVELVASLLPEEFDWRDVEGSSFVSDVRNQGSCGSCYSFSSIGQIESRLKILTNNSVDVTFSEQDIVECSQYSQGCEGGFPYLVAGKYAQDFGVVLEECNPYKGTDGHCRTKKCAKHYVSNYQYVGGYYGACNEESMKLALVHGGPLSVSFQVYDDFMHYSGGIYHHTGVGLTYDPFELTNHAVLLVGYGTNNETGEKFWSVKNSWGKGWGEDGYFRIRRGTDECAIESIAVEVIPIP